MTFLTKEWHLKGRRQRYDPNDKLAPYRDKRPQKLSEDQEAEHLLGWLTGDEFEPEE